MTRPTPSLKSKVLERFGDEGASTLDRYFAQLEYTAAWCVRLLDPAWRVRLVIPEAVEDLVVIRNGVFELRQIKTRDESVGAWRTVEVVPILAAQYYRSHFFGERRFSFHFVSDARADVRTPRGSLGSLERLKQVLSLFHSGEPFRGKESTQFDWFMRVLPPMLSASAMAVGFVSCMEEHARDFLRRTHIETNDTDVRTPRNVESLYSAIKVASPHEPERSLPELRDVYDRIILLIIHRIRSGTDLRTRAISRRDVLECLRVPAGAFEALDLSRLPGGTKLEKKTLLGGFEQTEVRQFRRQMAHAKGRRREIGVMGLREELQLLDLALGEAQRQQRRRLSGSVPLPSPFGPFLLDLLQPQLERMGVRYLPADARPSAMLCQGMLWESTQACFSAWHPMTSGSIPSPMASRESLPSGSPLPNSAGRSEHAPTREGAQ